MRKLLLGQRCFYCRSDCKKAKKCLECLGKFSENPPENSFENPREKFSENPPENSSENPTENSSKILPENTSENLPGTSSENSAENPTENSSENPPITNNSTTEVKKVDDNQEKIPLKIPDSIEQIPDSNVHRNASSKKERSQLVFIK